MNKELNSNLDLLSLLAETLSQPTSLDDALERITSMTCKLMDTDQACFVFRDETRRELMVRYAEGFDSPAVRAGHTLSLPDRLHHVLWNIDHIHRINAGRLEISEITFPILVAPVHVKGERIGLIIVGGVNNTAKAFVGSNMHRKIMGIICQFAALVIENSKVYDYLKQHFAATSRELRKQNKLDAANRGEAEQLMVTSLSDPLKVVRLLTESFFKELVQAGFNAGHIASGAAHLLNLVTQSSVNENGTLVLKK